MHPLVRNLAVFGPCPKYFSETKFRGDGLIYLVEGISRYVSVQAEL